MTLTFFVPGLARPKGSKRAFALKRGGDYTGRVALVESAGAPLKAWERQIALVAASQTMGNGLLTGPIKLTLYFFLLRPASHPKKRRTWPIGRPDYDKLARAATDALTGVVWRDDSQVVEAHVCKDWGDPPGVRVVIQWGDDG
jgi:Holliday junction resolvase RusA-like endonuclease